MARPLRIEFPGAVYHITSRGTSRADIFEDDADREMDLKILVGQWGVQDCNFATLTNQLAILQTRPHHDPCPLLLFGQFRVGL